MKRILLKIFLSVFVIFNLVTIIVLANGSSYVGRRLQKYILPYANETGLNTTWNFFAPDPAHTMYFKYTVYYAGDKDSLSGFYPPEKSQIVTDSSKRRFLYAMRFLILDPQRIETLLGPWACREFVGAQRVYFEHIIEDIPSYDNAVTSLDSDMDNMLNPQNSQRLGYDCEKNAPTNEN